MLREKLKNIKKNKALFIILGLIIICIVGILIYNISFNNIAFRNLFDVLNEMQNNSDFDKEEYREEILKFGVYGIKYYVLKNSDREQVDVIGNVKSTAYMYSINEGIKIIVSHSSSKDIAIEAYKDGSIMVYNGDNFNDFKDSLKTIKFNIGGHEYYTTGFSKNKVKALLMNVVVPKNYGELYFDIMIEKNVSKNKIKKFLAGFLNFEIIK